MHAGLAEHGVDARVLPMVMQYNKQDLPESLVASVDELSAALNFRARPEFSADALRGVGVFDTLRSLGTQVLRRLGAEDGSSGSSAARNTPGGADVIFPSAAETLAAREAASTWSHATDAASYADVGGVHR
jgi:hypothetical protein